MTHEIKNFVRSFGCCRLSRLAAFIVFGTSILVHGQSSLQAVIYGSPQQHLGRALEMTGDLNGDGVGDLLIGAPGGYSPFGGLGAQSNIPLFPLPSTGSVVAVNAASGQVLWTTPSAVVGDRFGAELCNLGDQDFDGVNDIAVGAPYPANGNLNTTPSGAILLISGMSGSVIASFPPPSAFQGLGLWGRTICNIGDRDGDGRNDFASGFPTLNLTNCIPSIPSPCPRTLCISTVTSAIILDIVTPPNSGVSFSSLTDAGYPYSIASIPDLDGDGVAEIIERGVNNGVSRIRVGATGNLWAVAGSVPCSTVEYGPAIAVVGDLDNNGLADFAAGNLQSDSVCVFAGGPTTGSGATLSVPSLWNRFGETGELFGTAVAPAGDVNGDGVPDILVGAPRIFEENVFPGPTSALPGSVYVLSGVDGSTIDRIVGPAPLIGFGAAVAALGDVNGDGLPEIAIGAYLDATGGPNAGAVYIYTVSPLAAPAARGTVGNAIGGSFDVLTANASAGEADRIVDVGLSQPIGIAMSGSIVNSAPFAVWGLFGTPQVGGLVPTSAGTFLFPPQPVAPSLPWLFTLTNNVWADPNAILPSVPAPWGFNFPSGIPIPFDFTLQGLIVGSGSSGPVIEITNAVGVRVR